MNDIHQKTIYEFRTSSASIARAIGIISNDTKCREMVTLFAKIESRKRRNVIMRMVTYLL